MAPCFPIPDAKSDCETAVSDFLQINFNSDESI
jgi:hypothetical protein